MPPIVSEEISIIMGIQIYLQVGFVRSESYKNLQMWSNDLLRIRPPSKIQMNCHDIMLIISQTGLRFAR